MIKITDDWWYPEVQYLKDNYLAFSYRGLKLDENVQDQIARIGNKMVQFIEQ